MDDERDMLDALKLIFSDLGYQVQAVASGEEALKALHAPEGNQPDLIVTDIIMPEMTGIQLFEAVRMSIHLADIPFLFISAHITAETEALIIKHDKAAFLPKPFEVERLIEIVEVLCGGA